MSFVSYVSFATIEYFAFFAFSLTLFRISFREFFPQVFFISVLASFLSHALRLQYEVSNAPLIQTIVLGLLIWQIFKMPLFYAAVITSIGSIEFIALQTLILIMGNATGLVDTSDFDNLTSGTTYMWQVIWSIANCLMAYAFYKLQWFLNFIPTGDSPPLRYDKINKLMLSGFIGSLPVIGLTCYWYSVYEMKYILVMILLQVIVIATLMVSSILREKHKE